MLPGIRTQVSWLPIQCSFYLIVLLPDLSGNSSWEALLLLSDFGITATAFSKTVFFSSVHREERDCTPSQRTEEARCYLRRRLWVLPLTGTPAPTVCMHVQAESHFPVSLQTQSLNLIIACGETFPQRLWFSHVAVTSKTSPLLCFPSSESSWENPA